MMDYLSTYLWSVKLYPNFLYFDNKMFDMNVQSPYQIIVLHN